MSPRRKRSGTSASGQAITPEQLERTAISYLERYPTTAENLRSVLDRRVSRAVQRARWASGQGEDPDAVPVAEARKWIDELVAKLVDLGYIDDRRFAESLVRQLRRRGTSQRAIGVKLRQKGVVDEITREILGEEAEGPAAELCAASAFARRRQLGPFRRAEEREDRRERDLAALARAGFGPDIAHTVVDAPAPEDLPARRGDSLFAH